MAADAKIERAACWIDKRLHQMAKELAARENLSIPEVLERDLAKPITRRYEKVFGDGRDMGEPVG